MLNIVLTSEQLDFTRARRQTLDNTVHLVWFMTRGANLRSTFPSEIQKINKSF